MIPTINHSLNEAIHAMKVCKHNGGHPDWDSHIKNLESLKLKLSAHDIMKDNLRIVANLLEYDGDLRSRDFANHIREILALDK